MTDNKVMPQLKEQILLNTQNQYAQIQDIGKPNNNKQSKWIILICFNICVVMLSHMMFVVYSNAVVRTLERRFALTSSQTGFLQSCNDIVHICLVVFIGYFSEKSNKPRIMSITVMFTAFSAFLMSSPHFILNDYQNIYEKKQADNKIYYNYTSSELCHQDDAQMNHCLDRSFNLSDKIIGGSIHPAYYIFVLAQMISGIGSSAIFTLSIAYMDENAPKNRASFYIGIVYSMFSFGPLTGLFLGAICLRLPENLTNGLKIDTASSNFIGCWWLGYMICGTLLTISGIPLWFYPNKIQNKENHENNKVEDVSILEQIKSFPTALKRLFSNRPYTVNLINIVCGAYIITGVFSNIVRYIEIHFVQRAFVGAIIAGIASALTGAIGAFSGGAIMARCKLRIAGALKLMIFTTSVLAFCIFMMLFIRCSQPSFHTFYDDDTQEHTVLSSCTIYCGCKTSRQAFAPICTEDRISYFSPCVAGCTHYTNNTYQNCSCLHKPNLEIAYPGLCRNDCFFQLILYSFVLLIFSFAGSFARVPATMVAFRIVGEEDKTFALGFNSFMMNLFGFIPAPIIFGYLIDKSCILWEKTCNVTGTCLLFNSDRFRNSIYGFTFAIEMLDLIIIIIVYILIRRSYKFNNLPLNERLPQIDIKENKM